MHVHVLCSAYNLAFDSAGTIFGTCTVFFVLRDVGIIEILNRFFTVFLIPNDGCAFTNRRTFGLFGPFSDLA